MANPPVPPQNPTTSPPPASDSPSVSLPVPNATELHQGDSLQNLSPFEVMKKRKQQDASPPPPLPSTPPVPPPVSPAAPATASTPPTREQLIEQAAKGPATPFVLPSNPSQETQQSTPPVVPAPAVTPSSTPVPPPVSPVASPPQRPTAPTPPAAVPKPVLPTTRRQPVQNSVVAPARPPRSGGKSLLLAMAGVVLVLILAAGGSYVLALTGVRVPVLYSYVSGLSPEGVVVAQNSTSVLTNLNFYQQHGEMSIKAKNNDGSDVLPSEAGTTDPIASITTKVTTDVPLQYSFQEQKISGREAITIDNLTEVPVYLDAQENGSWNFNLPANDVQPFVQVLASEVKNTLVYPSIQPVPLSVILSAAKTETGYQKVSGQKAAEYTYSLDSDILKEWLPNGATIQDPVGQVTYAWQTGKPVSTTISGIMTYQDRPYQFSQQFDYGNWDEEMSTTDSDLSALLSPTTDPEIDTADTFISQLGVFFIRVPNTIIDSSLISDTEPVTPSGQTATTAGSVITAIPPLPVTPASEEEINRDTQRQADLADLQKALQKYKLRQGQYPQVDGLVQIQASSTLFSALVGDYLTAMPVDPLQDTYWYEYESDGRTFVLRSVAEDASNFQAKAGKAFSYFEITGK